jgi:hypothetical protein
MTWWRELGKYSGHYGSGFSPSSMTCAYCDARGAFTRLFEAPPRQVEADHTLHYEVYKCNQCANTTFIMWGHGASREIHAYRQLPAPSKWEPPQHWETQLASAYEQAVKAVDCKSWDAAATMARRAVQVITRSFLPKSTADLRAEIDELVKRQELPKSMGEWAHEVRLLGNVGAHPDAVVTGASEADARQVLTYVGYLILYLIDIPQEIAEHKKRQQTAPA